MTITIREATTADLADVVHFNAAMALETEGKTLDRGVLTSGVRHALADPAKGRYFLAEIDGTTIGQLMFTLEWSDWRDGWFWWIQSVYVDRDFRRRGVFSSLYGHLAELASGAPDVCGLRLYVDGENVPAQRVYAKLGMDMTGYRVMEMPLSNRGSDDA
jgi:ribosomal protein S18 acetylase RimI-like enzyme